MVMPTLYDQQARLPDLANSLERKTLIRPAKK